MKIVALSGSKIGSKTRIAMNYTINSFHEKYKDAEVTLLDLAEYDVQFSDGRNYLEYEGDTKYVIQTIMEADVIVIGTPIFQASIPATLKNIFDLAPEKHFNTRL